jgi:hypothetical protein
MQESRTMDNPSNYECYTPSSEPFRLYKIASHSTANVLYISAYMCVCVDVDVQFLAAIRKH